MASVFAAIAPVFLLIIAGNLLKRAALFEPAFWRGLERMGFYVLYPVLLFTTISRADFSELSVSVALVSLAFAWTVLGAVTLALWPMLRAQGVSRPAYSSVFQTAVRWNGFVALAAAEKLFPPEGAAMVALAMAFIIIPINVVTVVVVAWFTEQAPKPAATALKVARNPLIIAAGAALLLRQMPFDLPGPVMDALHLVDRAALGMGLMAIGAGLQLKATALTGIHVLVPTLLKLAGSPLLVIGTGMMAGLDGAQLSYLALCAAVPTAMNGYVLAREMGGDADAYAVTVTLQTVISFVSIPLVLTATAYVTGG